MIYATYHCQFVLKLQDELQKSKPDSENVQSYLSCGGELFLLQRASRIKKTSCDPLIKESTWKKKIGTQNKDRIKQNDNSL